MSLDAFTIKHLAIELNEILVGAKVNKITQPTKEEIFLYVYGQGKNNKVVLCSNAKFSRVCTTKVERENPAVCPNFCMLLRKHLSSATITKISQVEDERIIKIDFSCKNDLFENVQKQLYVEIMGKYSNIVLVSEGIILGSLKTVSLDVNAARPLFSQTEYTLPKKQDKISPYDKENSVLYLKNYTNQNLSDYLFNGFSGISDFTAKEIAHRFCQYVFNAEIFYGKFIDFLENPVIKPQILYSENFTDFCIYDCKHLVCEKKYFNSIVECVSSFYDDIESKKDFALKQNSLIAFISGKLKKSEKRKASLIENIQANSDYDISRQKGDLILANLYRINKSDEFVVCENFYDDNKQIKITLDKTKTPQQNAEKYFKKYNKQKSALKYSGELLVPVEEEIEYLKSVLSEINICETIAELKETESEIEYLKKSKSDNKRDKNKKTPFRIYEYDNFTVFMGKNNISNDLLREQSSGKDMWFHAKGYHSAFVVAKCDKPITDSVIEFCASLCAYYSENKFGDSVEIDYTLIKFVKKPTGAKPGKVIYTNNKTVLVKPNPQTEFEIN